MLFVVEVILATGRGEREEGKISDEENGYTDLETMTLQGKGPWMANQQLKENGSNLVSKSILGKYPSQLLGFKP